MKIIINTGLRHQLFAGISASMCGFSYVAVFGFSTPVIPYLMSDSDKTRFSSEELVPSWVTYIPQLSCMVSPIPAALLADRYGRKPVILTTAPIFAVGWSAILVSRTFTALIVARLVQGLGMGIALSIIPIYLVEIASTDYRGAITSLYFICAALGFLFEQTAAPLMALVDFAVLTLSVCFTFFFALLYQPESPYFYLTRGNVGAATRSLKWFRSLPEDEMDVEIKRVLRGVVGVSYRSSVNETLGTSTGRKAMYILVFVGTLRALSGLLAVVGYAKNIFEADPHLKFPFSYFVVSLRIVIVVGSAFPFFVLDIVGRKPLLTYSLFVSAISLFTASLLYYLNLRKEVDVSSCSIIAPIAILVYAGSEMVGLYSVSNAYSVELFTAKTRALVCSVNVIFQTVFTFLAFKIYAFFTSNVGVYFNFLLYGIVCLVGSVVSHFYMPETKNKHFDEIRKELGENNETS